PKIELYPPIPYQSISKNHFLYDLIYNPSQTQFLNFGLKANATTVNGLRMLELQAERSWEIWDS
ncbi:MAG TPA: shikimate dehydrogenase, partial [Flavobacteriaceae bacterium]|nr:shikimate dehydrogenase [Flavobacteriaceae bacterium]